MALQQTVNYLDINVHNAYIKVDSFQGDKSTIDAKVVFKASAASPSFKLDEYKGIVWDFNLNPLNQIYTHLKTLPEFADAVDC